MTTAPPATATATTTRSGATPAAGVDDPGLRAYGTTGALVLPGVQAAPPALAVGGTGVAAAPLVAAPPLLPAPALVAPGAAPEVAPAPELAVELVRPASAERVSADVLPAAVALLLAALGVRTLRRRPTR